MSFISDSSKTIFTGKERKIHRKSNSSSIVDKKNGPWIKETQYNTITGHTTQWY